MDDATLREKVGQLLTEVRCAPGTDEAPASETAAMGVGGTSVLRREMAAVEDNLDHVRLAIKYLVFDLEATKRENRLLKEMLGDA